MEIDTVIQLSVALTMIVILFTIRFLTIRFLSDLTPTNKQHRLHRLEEEIRSIRQAIQKPISEDLSLQAILSDVEELKQQVSNLTEEVSSLSRRIPQEGLKFSTTEALFLHFRINDLGEDIKRTESSLKAYVDGLIARNTFIVVLFLTILAIILAIPSIVRLIGL
jgi:DNA repair exonuclease SbcCD ATPase subunit